MNDILNIYKRLVDTLIRYYHKDNEPINPLKANRAKSIVAKGSACGKMRTGRMAIGA